MRWRSLNVKLLIGVGVASVAAIGILATLGVRTQRAQLIDEVIHGASQLSDTVRQSTRHAMLENQWPLAGRTMDAIGSQDGVVRVRVFSKEGLILFSTARGEQGSRVDTRAEACYGCHEAARPLERLPLRQRSRIYARDGARVLGMITPIYNEPACSDAACHAHPAAQRVLGVLDVSLSLAQVDARVAATGRRIALQIGAFLLLVLALLWLFLRRAVIRPLRDLVDGTTRVRRGELDGRIPVRARDELGQLAASFNEMTAALAHTRAELAELVATLEQRVEERTTALAAAQAQVVQSEKLASLGQLAASVAHEINNPLAGILTYARLLIRRLGRATPDAAPPAETVRLLGEIQRETERCATIVKNLLGFARQRAPAFESVELNAVVRDALALVAHRCELQGVVIEARLGDVPLVRADAGQLRQVFVNVAMNAVDAMGAGGRLTVATAYAAGATMVEAAVSDTGPGIPAAIAQQIFEPFFTTKEQGTGLGLSVVYGIINRHGGAITIESPPGQGATVRLRLPVAVLAADAAGPDAAGPGAA